MNSVRLQSEAAARTVSQINSLLTQSTQRSKGEIQRPLAPAPHSSSIGTLDQTPSSPVMLPAGMMLLHAIQSKNTSVEKSISANPFQRDSSSGSKVILQGDIQSIGAPTGGNGSSSSTEKKNPLLWIRDYDMSFRLENKISHPDSSSTKLTNSSNLIPSSRNSFSASEKLGIT